MRDGAYYRALIGAEIVASGTRTHGITVWRDAGLQVVDLMVTTFLRRLRDFTEPVQVEHTFLELTEDYRQIFPDYNNVYEMGDWVLRADYLPANVRWLQRTGRKGPVVTTGGLLRALRGAAAPLFRERYIWPAVQLNQLIDPADSQLTLDSYREAVEATLADFAVPAVTVATEAPASYGRACLLTVSCLANGRPTVVATTYLMSQRYRKALDTADDVLDLGFTGKVLALVAMHHRDHCGLLLPAELAPIQLGVLCPTPAPSPDLARWAEQLRHTGLRLRLSAITGDAQFRRRRAERRLQRLGTPLVLGARAGDTWRISRRGPLRRNNFQPFPSSAALEVELAAHDAALRRRAQLRFQRGLRESGVLRPMCERCVQRSPTPVIGPVVPTSPRPCGVCSAAGREVLASEHGRFY